MVLSRGLVIADPWIGYILDGSKTWEMRSSATSVRGPFALIRKGTGAVWGVANLVDSLPPLSPEEMIATHARHLIPAEMIRSGEVAKWNTPWVLADVRPLAKPVPYKHPYGAVTWVTLEPDVCAAIARQLGEPLAEQPVVRSEAPARAKETAPRPAMTPVPASMPAAAPAAVPVRAAAGALVAQTQLTGGNIRNNHFHLRGHVHRFPDDLIGGSNRHERAPKEASIDWGGGVDTLTDIDGEKQFFRGRGWIRQFFEKAGAEAGDWVLVEETGPYRYKVSLKKA